MFWSPRLDATLHPVPLVPELAAHAPGVTAGAHNTMLPRFGDNALKGWFRSHPEVAARHHPDLVPSSTCEWLDHGADHADVELGIRPPADEGSVMPNPSIKDEETYEKVREQGASKEKAARIANAAAAEGRTTVAKRGGSSPSYEDMTKDELYERAQKVGIRGRSSMSKDQLIDALRNH